MNAQEEVRKKEGSQGGGEREEERNRARESLILPKALNNLISKSFLVCNSSESSAVCQSRKMKLY